MKGILSLTANFPDGEPIDLGLAVLKVICLVPKTEEVFRSDHETAGVVGGKSPALS